VEAHRQGLQLGADELLQRVLDFIDKNTIAGGPGGQLVMIHMERFAEAILNTPQKTMMQTMFEMAEKIAERVAVDTARTFVAQVQQQAPQQQAAPGQQVPRYAPPPAWRAR